MQDKLPDKEVAALKADVARLREELAALAAGLKPSADERSAGVKDEGANEAAHGNGHDKEEESYGAWEDLLRKLNSSKAQGEKVVRGLSSEIERHPLVSVMAAFGLGYIIAKLWYEENKQ